MIYFGCTQFSKAILTHLIKNKVSISAVFSIPEEFGISYSTTKVKNYNFVNMESTSKNAGIPFYLVESSEGSSTLAYKEVIREINPDLILVMGWYYMVPKKIRDLAKHGAWGLHASLLPKYAGGAPLVWAIINGEKETGVSLFQLESGVDDGAIVAQSVIKIENEDTIKEVYDKATDASKEIIIDSLINIDTIAVRVQDKGKINVWPQRKPDDGEIDWSWDNQRIWNFVRAQARPYPGAFTYINGERISIWNREDIERYRPVG